MYRALKLGFKNRLKEITDENVTDENVKKMIRWKIVEYGMKQMNAEIDNRKKNKNDKTEKHEYYGHDEISSSYRSFRINYILCITNIYNGQNNEKV